MVKKRRDVGDFAVELQFASVRVFGGELMRSTQGANPLSVDVLRSLNGDTFASIGAQTVMPWFNCVR